MDTLLNEYFKIPQPGSYGGIHNFSKHSKLKSRDVSDFLSGKNAYTLHKQTKNKFRRRKTYSHGIDDLWQADLVDMSSLANYNDSYRYLFTCIDVFSKVSRVIPIKNKTGKSITSAFSQMISGAKPVLLQTDKGSEFLNATFQAYLRDNSIKHYTSENDDLKASVCERFNRTLKTKMWRYFTHASTLRYVDILDDLVKSYNNTFHRTIGMHPTDVSPQNE